MVLIRILSLFGFFLLVGCSAAVPQKPTHLTPVAGQSLLTIYLTTSGTSLSALSYRLDSVEIYVDDAWLGLDFAPKQVVRDDNRGRQLLIGVALAPSGEHRKIRLQISNLMIDGQLLADSETTQTVEVVLPRPLLLEERESRCLFVDWSLPGGAKKGQLLALTFTAKAQANPLAAELVYVACDDINTVYLLRGDNNQVVASFAIPGPLGEIRVDQRTRKLYILSSGQQALYVYDCVKFRLLERIALPGTIDPRHLVLSSDGKQAYVSDAISGQVLKINLAAGVVTAQRRLSHRPGKLTFFSSGSDRLAVVAPAAQKIYLLGSEALTVLSDFSVGMQPSSLLFFAGSLYVTEQSTNMVAVYEHQSGRLLERIPVGLRPTDLLSIGDQQLWVTNGGGASISVLVAGQRVALRRIKASSAPFAMERFVSRNLIYIISHQQKSLTVVGFTSGQIRKTVALAGTPRAIAVLE